MPETDASFDAPAADMADTGAGQHARRSATVCYPPRIAANSARPPRSPRQSHRTRRCRRPGRSDQRHDRVAGMGERHRFASTKHSLFLTCHEWANAAQSPSSPRACLSYIFAPLTVIRICRTSLSTKRGDAICRRPGPGRSCDRAAQIQRSVSFQARASGFRPAALVERPLAGATRCSPV